jgi:hypothetical protein
MSLLVYTLDSEAVSRDIRKNKTTLIGSHQLFANSNRDATEKMADSNNSSLFSLHNEVARIIPIITLQKLVRDCIYQEYSNFTKLGRLWLAITTFISF